MEENARSAMANLRLQGRSAAESTIALSRPAAAAAASSHNDDDDDDEDDGAAAAASSHIVVKAPRGAKKRRAGDAPHMNGKKIELVETIPMQYCAATNPCPYVDPGRHLECVGVWEIQFDATYWPMNPRGLVNLAGENAHTTSMVLRMLFLVGFLVQQVVSPKVEMQEDEETHRMTKVVVSSTSSLRVTWERVPHHKNPNHFVAYRLRIVEYGVKTSRHCMIHELLNLMARNQNARMTARVKGGHAPKFAVGPESYTHITQNEWNGLCQWHRPGILVDLANCPVDAINNIFHPDCPYRPGRAFDVRQNLQTAAALGADPRYCDPSIYMRPDQWGNGYRNFAENGKNVYDLPLSALDPVTLRYMWMPHQEPNPKSFLPEMIQYGKMHGLDLDNLPLLRKIFNATCNRSSQMQEANDMNALTERIKTEKSELRSMYKSVVQRPGHTDDVDDGYYRALEHARTSWLQLIGEILTPVGDCPPTMQVISQELEHYLMNNNRIMSMPIESSFSNLTRFQNMRASEAVQMDQIMTVATSHADCLLYLYSALHVYSRVPMNVHHLLLGPPGIGKSFALLLLTLLLIKGTWRTFTYVTAKGLCVPGKVNACLIMIFEDAPATMFGIQGGSGGAGKKGSSSDQENMMKQFMTSMDMTVQSITMEPKRAAESIHSETGCVMFVAMNDSSSEFPIPLLDRFTVTISAQEESSSEDDDYTIGMLEKTQRAADPAVLVALAELKISWARRQMLCAYLFHLESCGILNSIDTSAADKFYAQVTAEAKKRHINMTRTRSHKRFQMLVRVMVVINAIDMLWDCPGAPLADIPFSMDHFLMANKYMVSSVQMGVFVMGMLARQWQDNARASIVLAMKKHWFPKAGERLATYKNLKPLRKDGSDPLMDDCPAVPPPPEGYNPFVPKAGVKPGTKPPPRDTASFVYDQEAAIFNGMRNEKKFWMYDNCVIGGPLLPAAPSTGKFNVNIDDTVKHLASKIIVHLESRFLPFEVAGKIRAMLTDTVQVQRSKIGKFGNDDDIDCDPDLLDVHKQDVPQLVIDGTSLRMALPTLELAEGGSDVLFKCVEEVVTKIYAASNKCPGPKNKKKKNADAVPMELEGDAAASSDPEPEAHTIFLYGETETRHGARFVWRVIRPDKVKAATLDRSTLCRVNNAAYADPALQKVTQDFLKSINPEYYDPRSMRRFYSADTPFTVMDVNIDTLAAAQHADHLGLSASDQHDHPSNDCTRTDPVFKDHFKALAKSRSVRMFSYPKCFKGMDQKKDRLEQSQMFRQNPEAFKSSTELQRLRDRQNLRFSLYELEPTDRVKLMAEARVARAAAAAASVVVVQSQPLAIMEASNDEDVDSNQEGLDLEDEEAYKEQRQAAGFSEGDDFAGY